MSAMAERGWLQCAVCGVSLAREAAITVAPFSDDAQVFDRFVCSAEHERVWVATAGRRWRKRAWSRRQRIEQGGTCRECGGPTKYDQKAGRPHRLCHGCQHAALIELRRKRRAVRRAIVEALWKRGEPWAEIQRRARLTPRTRPWDLRALGYDLPRRPQDTRPAAPPRAAAPRRAKPKRAATRRRAPQPGPQPTTAELDARARAAYEAGHAADAPSACTWDELAEWKREAWRCEVDASRDPRGIVAAQRGRAAA